MNKLVAPLLMLLQLFLVPAVTADLVVIVHPDTPLEQMNATEVKRLFLGKLRHVDSDIRLIPINQDPGLASRLAFEVKILKKTGQQLRAYWVEQIFTGKSMPPRSEGGDEAVRHLIATEKGHIGYIDQQFLNHTVKAVLTIP